MCSVLLSRVINGFVAFIKHFSSASVDFTKRVVEGLGSCSNVGAASKSDPVYERIVMNRSMCRVLTVALVMLGGGRKMVCLPGKAPDQVNGRVVDPVRNSFDVIWALTPELLLLINTGFVLITSHSNDS
ncbi:hypothetical protein J6590_058824 [Homalodisca vitripennis]|nr:hypothetical protein J6590_058824 [Homalodisca vitripennis]